MQFVPRNYKIRQTGIKNSFAINPSAHIMAIRKRDNNNNNLDAYWCA